MKVIITIFLAAMTFITADARKYSYRFNNTPVSQAIVNISKDNPDENISFIYKELDNYITSAVIHTDDLYEALRQTVGFNPVTVIKKDGKFYLEALQHGKYIYTGQAIDSEHEPVVSATVMLLSPNDSTVITYGVTDNAGRFSIPCDRQNVMAKLTCVGFTPAYRHCNSFAVGVIEMKESPVLLQSVNVENDYAALMSDRSVYIPTSRQKKSSQTAQDLISRMAIPQLGIGDEIKTNGGQPVELYIDFVPATESELSGMRIDDVKRIEYYDYPSDPRFQGDHHVINFIMQKYEYGGYVKGVYYDNFISSRQLNGYAKAQYKKMTYDCGGGAFLMTNGRSYEETYETYRLPQSDGSIREFERNSLVTDNKKRRQFYWSSFKAMYRTDKATISNMLSLDFQRTPKQHLAGKVSYSPAEFSESEYTSTLSNRNNSVVYSGYWFFVLPHNNSITFNPHYAYTHTNQNSVYDETGIGCFVNGAKDDSHQASGNLSFVHSFGSAGTLKAMCQGNFLQNRTHYYGTSSTSDMARTYRLGPGINYSFSTDLFYCNAGVGLHWDKSSYEAYTEHSTAPWGNVALQYSFNKKNSISLDFDYRKSIPASSYRSASVVQSNPFMSYTGNPSLVPYNSLQAEGSYVFIPNNRFSFSAYGWVWMVDNRYVFCYEAGAEGILRTIRQPMGDYAQWQYGIKASTRLFNNNLHLSASVYMVQAHNGMPYNWNKAKLTASASAYYYVNNLYFGASYDCPEDYPDGCMVGEWMHERNRYTFQIGWSNSHWNLRFFTRNFLRFNTHHAIGTMHSPYYDTVKYYHDRSNAGFFQIMATYTFSFGKKIKSGDEVYQANGASSGILK